MGNAFVADDEMTFDFSKFGGPTGVIPEPSTRQIETFMEVLRQTMPTTRDDQGHEVLDVPAIAEIAKDSDLEAVLYSAVADVCSGHPSVQEIMALPFRPQRRFIGWLLGTLLDPEA